MSKIHVIPSGARNLGFLGTRYSVLSLRELEALSRALLSVLLPFLAARVTSDQALGLQLAAQFRVKLHQRPRNPELYRIGLTTHSAAQHVGDNVERSRRIGGSQRRFRR